MCATVARSVKFCQTHDTMAVPLADALYPEAIHPMIRYLAIRNLAVIESVAVEFEQSFNVLTGETGAGKSILVEAVGLLLGGRASADLVRTGEESPPSKRIFETADGSEVIVRREITAQGRSRAFINGALATAAALKDLSRGSSSCTASTSISSCSIPHSTCRSRRVGWPRRAGRAAVAAAWAQVRACEAARSLPHGRPASGRRGWTWSSSSWWSCAARKLQPGEDETLQPTGEVLRSADAPAAVRRELRAALRSTKPRRLRRSAGLEAGGGAGAIDPRFAPYLDARDGIKAQLEDLAFTLRDYADGIDASPARLQQVEDRLALLERLKRKHGRSLEDVDRQAASPRAEHAGADRRAEQRGARSSTQLREAAARASSSRRRRLSDSDGARRRRARGEHRTASSPTWRWSGRGSRSGCRRPNREPRGLAAASTTGEFFLSPNVGEDSGRSRGSCRAASCRGSCWRSRRSTRDDAARTQTLIFDEVDAGIGGRVATSWGRSSQALGERFQVLCITHLPQIAACGRTHFLIEKRVRGPPHGDERSRAWTRPARVRRSPG